MEKADNIPKQNLNLRTILGFVISAILLWLTFHNSGLHLSDIRLKGDQLYFFSAAIAVLVFSFWLYSIRAKLIWLNRSKKNSSISTYESLILGNFYNSLLPGNLGEGIRAWHFSRKNNVPFSRSLAGIITEKWLDAQIFAVLVLVFFTLKPFASHYIAYALACTALAVLALTIIYSLMRVYTRIEKNIWLGVVSFGKAGRFLYKMYSHTSHHLSNMKSNGAFGSYIILFMIIFILNGLQFFLLQKAAGVTSPVAGVYSSYLISLSMMIIAFIPSAPGNIGVLHYGVYSALILAAGQYGINPDNATLQSYALFAVYAHLSYLIPEVIMGAVFLIKERKIIFGG